MPMVHNAADGGSLRRAGSGYQSVLGVLVFVASLVGCGAATSTPYRLRSDVVAAVRGTAAESVMRVDRLSVLSEQRYSVAKEAPFVVPMLAAALGNSIEDGIVQRRVKPLAELTVGMDFHAQYAGALRAALGEIGWLKLRGLEQREAAASLDEQARLRSTTSLVLSPKSSVLFVESVLHFFPAGAAVDAPGAVALILYRSEEITPERDTMAVLRWAKNGGEAYRSSLSESISESMKMTTMALNSMAGTRYSGKAEALLVWIDGEPQGGGVSAAEPDEVKGTVIEETPQRLILQVGAGSFVSLPKSAIGSREVLGTIRGVAWHAPAQVPALAPTLRATPPAVPSAPPPVSTPAETPW